MEMTLEHLHFDAFTYTKDGVEKTVSERIEAEPQALAVIGKLNADMLKIDGQVWTLSKKRPFSSDGLRKVFWLGNASQAGEKRTGKVE